MEEWGDQIDQIDPKGDVLTAVGALLWNMGMGDVDILCKADGTQREEDGILSAVWICEPASQPVGSGVGMINPPLSAFLF